VAREVRIFTPSGRGGARRCHYLAVTSVNHRAPGVGGAEIGAAGLDVRVTAAWKSAKTPTIRKDNIMIRVRRSAERGYVDFGWLKSRHTFSFGNYHDEKFMGFGPLRVINEDRVEPGRGFGQHSHQNMEILSWVLDGALAHKDSIGTGAVIVPGEMQRMTAGIGIAHSEFNNSSKERVHFLQIWILPAAQNLKPGYEQRNFSGKLENRLLLVASADGRAGSVLIHQDVDLYAARLAADAHISHQFKTGRLGWMQVARGSVELNGQALKQGDGAAIADLAEISLDALEDAEVLLFDMAASPAL
jgi:redox-sensitive bicupin YhaK (pirin superfamily)